MNNCGLWNPDNQYYAVGLLCLVNDEEQTFLSCWSIFRGRRAAGMCLAVAAAIGPRPPSRRWRYVVPKAGDPMEHPPLRELSLSEKKPPDLKESAHYRGSRRRYGEFRFGAAGSTLVTVVLDSVSAAQTDIYVDRNRNRVIEEDERLAGPGPEYRVPLNVEIPKGEPDRALSAHGGVSFGQVGAVDQLRHGRLRRGHAATGRPGGRHPPRRCQRRRRHGRPGRPALGKLASGMEIGTHSPIACP